MSSLTDMQRFRESQDRAKDEKTYEFTSRKMAIEKPFLPVMFRADAAGVTAVFPTLPYNARRTECDDDVTCYAHVGQHSGCAWQWIATTRPATPDEYEQLLREVTHIYDDMRLLII